MAGVDEVWRYQGGFSQSEDFIYGVAAAADNSVFFAISQNTEAGSNSDLAVAKIDADGNLLWDWQEGSEAPDELFYAAAVVDGVVACGRFSGTWNGVTSSGSNDFAAVKLYSNGTVAWRWQEGTDEEDYLLGAAETVDGNVVVAGYTLGSWNDTNDGWNDVAAVKLNVDDGEVIWRYQAGTTGGSGAFARAAAAREDGSVVLGGETYGSFAKNFTGGTDATDFLALAIDEDGNELWRWQINARRLSKDGPGTGFNSIKGIATFDDGSVLLAGSTEGSWSGENLGGMDFAVTKLSESGNMEWTWQSGTAFDDEFEGAALGLDGSVIISGNTYGSWAATQEGDDGDRDFVAISINAGRNISWAYQAGTTSEDDFNNVAVRPDGLIVLGGWTRGIWTMPDEIDSYADSAAVLLDINASAASSTSFSTLSSMTFPTPSPITPSTPSPITLPTPFSTPYPTPSPTLSSSPQSAFASPGPSTPANISNVESTGSTETESGAPVGIIIVSSVGGVAIITIIIACLFFRSRGGKRSATAPPPYPSTIPVCSAPVGARTQGPNTAGVNASAEIPPPAYAELPPPYSEPPSYSAIA